MIIEINNSKMVREIQEEFSGKFPFLKLEFFYAPHEYDEPSLDTPCRPDLVLADIRKRNVYGVISIDSNSVTGAIEKEFEKRFGLNVQIYRRQMDKWIQTVGTDMLTLSEQNEIAKDSAIYFNPNHEEHTG